MNHRRTSADEQTANSSEYDVLIKMDNERIRIDVQARLLTETSVDPEAQVYETVIEDIQRFLHSRQLKFKYSLQIPQHFWVEEAGTSVSSIEEIERNSSTTRHFLLENVRSRGYTEDVLTGSATTGGLDYEHCVVAMTALARFHASSYCYFKLQNIDLDHAYPFLQSTNTPRIEEKAKGLVDKLLSMYPQFKEIYEVSLKDDVQQCKKANRHFDVLCHGNFWRENILFSYCMELESRYLCNDAITFNLGSCEIGSCALDILHFLFTSVDSDVRSEHFLDLACSVYHNNFVKAVSVIEREVPVFSMKSLILELENNLMLGFVTSVNFHYRMLMDDDASGENEEEETSRYDLFEENIGNVIKNILQFKTDAWSMIY